MTHLAIVVDQMKCTGCQICEIACSKTKEEKLWLEASRIKTFPFSPGIDIVVVCQQCEEAPCLEVCPVDAIERDPNNEAVIIDEEKCINCQKCVDACKLGAIFVHPFDDKPIKCDLCGGDPECVKKCPTDAIEYQMKPTDELVSMEEIAKNIRKKIEVD
ncbi:MAG: 4Fe-4S dicluster domain-containing protein [Thermoplasmatota archaeon]